MSQTAVLPQATRVSLFRHSHHCLRLHPSRRSRRTSLLSPSLGCHPPLRPATRLLRTMSLAWRISSCARRTPRPLPTRACSVEVECRRHRAVAAAVPVPVPRVCSRRCRRNTRHRCHSRYLRSHSETVATKTVRFRRQIRMRRFALRTAYSVPTYQ